MRDRKFYFYLYGYDNFLDHANIIFSFANMNITTRCLDRCDSHHGSSVFANVFCGTCTRRASAARFWLPSKVGFFFSFLHFFFFFFYCRQYKTMGQWYLTSRRKVFMITTQHALLRRVNVEDGCSTFASRPVFMLIHDSH